MLNRISRAIWMKSPLEAVRAFFDVGETVSPMDRTGVKADAVILDRHHDGLPLSQSA